MIARLGVVDGKRTGLAASMIVGYQKAMDIFQAREKAAKIGENSRYQGTEGQRLRSLDVTVLAVITMPETEWGQSYLLKLLDAAGNLYVSFTGSPQVSSADVGTVVRIDGTVKRHETYEGVQQTTLSRVTVWSAEGIAAADAKAAKKAAKLAKRQTVTT